MSKQKPYTTGRYQRKSTGALGRSEQFVEDERPFAEVRKTVHDALRMLSLHRWAFAGPFCVVTCAAFISSLYYPRAYQATTTFERRNDPVMMNLPLSNGSASFKYFRNTMVRDLTSVDYMQEVVDNLGLTKDFERTEDGHLTESGRRRRLSLARTLAGTIGVSTTSPSEQIDIIRVTYTGPDPHIGKSLVDEVKRTYIRRTMVWIKDFLTGQREYFTREADEVLARVKSSRREETQMRLENPHVDPNNPGAIALKLSQLEMERRELELREREYEAEQSALQQLHAATAPSSDSNEPTALRGAEILEGDLASPEAFKLSGQMRKIGQEIQNLKSTQGMTDLHPRVAELRKRQRVLAAALDAQRDRDTIGAVSNVPIDATVMNATLASMAASDPMQGERARLLVQIAAQKSKLKDIRISLDTNERAAKELRRAKREVFQKQEQFAEVTGKVAQARQEHRRLLTILASIEPAIKAIEQGRLLQFSKGQPARGSGIPTSPKAMTVVILSLIAGIVAGVLLVILAEVFDNVFRSSSQVARSLGLPMLEAIDEIVTPQDRRVLFLRKVVFVPAIVFLLAGLTAFSGSMAYLSLERPWTYQKIKKIPQAALQLFAGEPENGNVG